MSKRKRKKKSNAAGSAAKSKPASQQPNSAEASLPAKRNQRGMLWLGLGLLLVAVVLNYQRFRTQGTPVSLPLPKDPIAARPLAPRSTSQSSTRFTRLPSEQTGIQFAHPIAKDHPMAYLYFASLAAGGTAVGDVNQDGRPDIFIASGPAENKLYLQTETPFQFADATNKAGLRGDDLWSTGATMVDINADGRLDIFVAIYDAPNQLFINLGDGSFEDRAAEYGLNMTDASLEGAFADYDRDGDLDLYLLTYRFENPNGMPQKAPITYVNGERAIQPDSQRYYEITNDSMGYGIVGRWDGLLRNNGDGTFTNVSYEAGIRGPGHGQSVTWWDFDQDGFVDIHVGNDFNDADRLYHNQGDGTFRNVIQKRVPHTTWFSMGADVGDLDGDGLPDLLSSDMSSTTHFKQKTTMGSMGRNLDFLTRAIPRQYMRNALLLNSTTERFREAAYLAGLESTDWTWSVKLADFDCDGRLDAFFTNGSVRTFSDSDLGITLSERVGKTEWDIYKDADPMRESNLVFQNEGNLSFKNQSKAWGLDHLGVSMACAHADLDGDGDLDLVVANLDEPISIYRNDSQEHRRITLRLHGLQQNRFGIGARVTAKTSSGSQLCELQPTRGFLASNQPIVHFGCGDSEQVDIEVHWPDGTHQAFPDLATNSHYEVVQQPNQPRSKRPSRVAPLFKTQAMPAEFSHLENEFDDYTLQSLLPFRMSALGPGLAAGDANGDGHVDLFLGGSAGHPGRVAVWKPAKQEYEITEQPTLLSDQAYEDMGAVWLDVDGDDDVDLFVASGGNEHPANSELYRPRLYLNDGAGGLKSSADWLPDIRVSGGPVCAADFDHDGDVDLFLGGRQVPGKYPLPTDSYLLLNEGDRYVDASADLFQGRLEKCGRVTGALWTDVDNDQDLDLLVAREWDAIQLFRNEEGKFVDDSAAAGLTSFRGWWTGITSIDCDNDGDMDYVATNLGENTKYHASDEKPFRIFFGDFEGDGNRKLVEAEYEHEKLFPVRGKSCSTHAMPSLGNKFTTYKDFAAATVEEIYTPQCLEESYHCSANLFSSVLLRNKGEGRFEVVRLPVDAQLAPGFGTVVGDFNADETPDVFVAQNFFSPQPETGNMDGGLGTLLSGNGDGTFTPISPDASGIVIPQDAMAAVLEHRDRGGAGVLVSTNNDSTLRMSKNTQHDQLVVRFTDARSTAALAGARLVVRFENGTSRYFEISAGSGYLSQQPPVICVFRPSQQSGTIRFEQNGEFKEKRFGAEDAEIQF